MRSAQELAAKSGAGELAIADVNGGNVIVLKSDELFGSGSAQLNAALHPMIERIADALNKVPGAIVVTGHTDDLPIRRRAFRRTGSFRPSVLAPWWR
jgi:type VI secretion system protein ImpK